MMSTAEEIVETVALLLAQLGTDRDAVANSLRKAGITGMADNVLHDPIANYLKANGITAPEVDLEQVALDAYEHPDGFDGPIRVLHPAAVRNFLLAFDNGAYADLRASEVNT